MDIAEKEGARSREVLRMRYKASDVQKCRERGCRLCRCHRRENLDEEKVADPRMNEKSPEESK